MTDIARATILGTGTMGPGMGAVLARAGIQVSLYDVSAEALERAKGGVEIAGEKTSPEAVRAVEDLTRRIGYHPVTLKKEVPGFVENRVLYAIMRECLALMDEGVIDAEGLDLCVQWGIGYKLAVIPPIHLLDVAGLDIYTSVASYLNQDLSDEKGVSSTAQKLHDDGRLGIKAGGGFFDYTPELAQQLQQERAGKLVAVRKALG